MTFRERLLNREQVLGTWFTIPSAAAADIICTSGIDFLIIDREHGPHSFETVLASALAAEARGVAPLVRCTHVDQAEILRCLDLGIAGIQVPNIEDVSQLSSLLEFSLYPPEGNRGFSLFTRNGEYGRLPATEMTSKRNDETAIIVNVESIESANAIDELISIDRIDAIFIGLYDLSRSLGRPGDFSSTVFKDAVRKVTDACVAKGKSVGTICATTEVATEFSEMGMNYLVYSVDCNVVRKSYSDFVAAMQSTK
ncbi:aldolase/citrate lyase family protein [Shimia sp. R9_3]|uniref:HpcH/HpaI aldolase family protein n=1 Tax=Shimia sp. R9_3 TaxID=2821113 RepID=UPI001ADAE027|nr:aldolase/citrate lyase family protein [Shimia sp. R9_3]MBO9399406.1 hypothetical protein [Shimia sp. R9_3]